jgi:Hypothetical glycosyl hydrolase family 15
VASFPISLGGFSAGSPPGGKIVVSINSAQLTPIAVQAAPYSANPNELVPVDASAGTIPITLPAAPPNGTLQGVQAQAQSTDPVTGALWQIMIAASGTDVFESGSAFFSLGYLHESIVFQYDATNGSWYAINHSIAIDGLDQRYVLNSNPSNITGTLTADALGVNGLAGQTTPVTIRGAISTTGPPTSGTWNTGDLVIDPTNAWQQCTAGGTPGNWVGGTVSGVAPVVTTLAQTLLTQTSVQLNGTVNPGNLTTSYHFEWGPDTNYGNLLPKPDQAAGSDAMVHTLAQGLTGLVAATTYHYRIVATNGAGSVNGSDQSFTTLAATPSPTVSAPASSAIQQTIATVTGSVNPNGAACNYQFQYGPTNAYGTNLPASPAALTTNNTPQVVSANLTGLTANTVYHWNLQAVGANGTTNSGDQTFTTLVATPAPTIVSQGPVLGIQQTLCSLQATVNPNGVSTTVQFQYGLTSGYGSVIPASPSNIGSGTVTAGFSTSLTGLTANTVYHWSTQAINANGTTNGADQAFTTQAAAAPTVVTNAATGLTTTAATLNGTVNPNSTATTYQFQYGLTTAYGSFMPAAAASAGSGGSAVAETAVLSGLTPGTAYHFRLTGTNATATTNGLDQTFTTVANSSNTVVKFERTTYTGSYPLSLATDVAHGIQIYIPNNSSNVANIHAAAATAGKPMKVLQYVNFLQTNPATGIVSLVNYNTASANGWLAKNAAGHLINGKNYLTTYLLDLTNAGMLAAGIANCKSLCAAGGFDGVFFDNTNGYLPIQNLLDATTGTTTVPTFAPTSTQFTTVVASALTTLCTGLHGAGYFTIGNTPNVGIVTGQTKDQCQLFGPILGKSPGGGIYIESFADGGLGLAQQMQGLSDGLPPFLHALNDAKVLDGQGVTVICHNQNTTSAGQIYGLAAMMLVTTGNCYYTTDRNLAGTDNWFTPEYANALASGAAVDGPVTLGTANGTGADTGLYVRRFTNYTVKVNFTAGTINSIGAYSATIA